MGAWLELRRLHPIMLHGFCVGNQAPHSRRPPSSDKRRATRGGARTRDPACVKKILFRGCAAASLHTAHRSLRRTATGPRARPQMTILRDGRCGWRHHFLPMVQRVQAEARLCHTMPASMHLTESQLDVGVSLTAHSRRIKAILRFTFITPLITYLSHRVSLVPPSRLRVRLNP